MSDLETIEVVLTGERVVFHVPMPAPVTRGSVDVCLSTARGGPALHSNLNRALAVTDGKIPPLSLFTADVRAMWPRGGRCWLVVRYAGQLMGTGAVQLFAP